jgi:hypothetical protein
MAYITAAFRQIFADGALLAMTALPWFARIGVPLLFLAISFLLAYKLS